MCLGHSRPKYPLRWWLKTVADLQSSEFRRCCFQLLGQSMTFVHRLLNCNMHAAPGLVSQ
jgi:hypothetical protein